MDNNTYLLKEKKSRKKFKFLVPLLVAGIIGSSCNVSVTKKENFYNDTNNRITREEHEKNNTSYVTLASLDFDFNKKKKSPIIDEHETVPKIKDDRYENHYNLNPKYNLSLDYVFIRDDKYDIDNPNHPYNPLNLKLNNPDLYKKLTKILEHFNRDNPKNEMTLYDLIIQYLQ